MTIYSELYVKYGDQEESLIRSGAGTTFKSRAVACLLAALLGEAGALGDGARLVIENTERQRSGTVAGFDDAIVRYACRLAAAPYPKDATTVSMGRNRVRLSCG